MDDAQMPSEGLEHADGCGAGLDLAERRVVLFDFDGTLVNTGPCVIRACRAVLTAHGFTEERMGDLSRFIGPPLIDCFRDTCGLTPAEAEAYVAEYRAVFDTFAPADYPLFPGVARLVDALAAAGRTVAVATSRLEPRAIEMARDLGLDRVATIKGYRAPERLSKADSIRDALVELGARPADAVMVGDRHHDVEGAAAFSIPCIGVCYSGTAPEEFERAGAVLACDTVEELAHALGVAW